MTADRGAVRVSIARGTAHATDMPRTIGPGTTVPTGLPVVVGRTTPRDADGRGSVEIVVDGWRFELIVEDAARAELRERASRDRSSAAGAGGPLEIRAIIPGRIATVSVARGDIVALGQTLLTVEAMKMQNELRAPHAGSIARLAVEEGQTIELGDLLVILE